MTDFFKVLLGVVSAPILIGGGLVLFYTTLQFMGINVAPVLAVLIATTPFWLPLLLSSLAYMYWKMFVRKWFAIDNGRVTLRLKLPQEVLKSPEAMERVFSQIYNPSGADNPYNGWFEGRHPLIFSFELVSIGGDIRFYINVPRKKTKNAIEAQLYAQYPGIEIMEEEIDYTAEIPWDTDRFEYMSFRMNKKDDQEFPIRTYVDCGLDKMPKEEEKVEPMAPMLEQLSMVQKHERVWIQILARPHAKMTFKNGEIKSTTTWESKIQEKIDKIMGRKLGTTIGPAELEEQPRLTTGERDKISAMERNASKYAYETAIRWMYIVEKGKFNGDFIGPMIRTFSEFDIIGRNGIAPKWRTDFDYNYFQDPSGKRKLRMKKSELDSYKLRDYYREKSADAPKIFTTEELATMYHLPGRAVVTPALERITSTRRDAPSNLPTG